MEVRGLHAGGSDLADGAGGPRSFAARVCVVMGAILLFTGFVALGSWQLHRRAGKLDLIARVEKRVHAPAERAPAEAQWLRVRAAADEYRHVTATGVFLNESETIVQATTELGLGFWVLTPLRLTDGSVVLVNRGFVPLELGSRASRTTVDPKGLITVTGLLRMTESGGAFLRHNDAAADRWYSRDVQAIATARSLTRVAPYFIDAEVTTPATDEPLDGGALGFRSGPAGRPVDARAGVPVAGLTVIAFDNNHLVYAITWYTLALMIVGAMCAQGADTSARASREGRPGSTVSKQMLAQDGDRRDAQG